MNWLMLAALVLKFFTLLLEELLKQPLEQAAAEAGRDLPASYYVGGLEAAAVEKLFDLALAELPAWNPLWWPRRRLLKACKRQAVARAGEFYAAMRFGTAVPTMTPAEAKELAAALAV